MNINLAKLEQAEMDKVNVDLAAAEWHLRSDTICPLLPKLLNANSQNIYATGSAKDSSRTARHPFRFHVYLTSLKLNKTYITLRFLT